MPTPPAQPVLGQPAQIYLRPETVAELLQFRRGDERLNDTVARLIRFVKRMMPAAEARVREEFLP
jgi:hypothetical protein